MANWPTASLFITQCSHKGFSYNNFQHILRFLNGGVLRNLNMYSSQKVYPVCSATWLSDALKPKKFRKYSLINGK